jgi:hypothetical protein
MTVQKLCSEITRSTQWTYRSTCRNRAKVEVDGKPYCGIHDPAKVKARRAESNRKYMAQLSQKKVQWTREALERETCWGVPTETLRAGLLKELLEEYDRCPRNHGIE